MTLSVTVKQIIYCKKNANSLLFFFYVSLRSQYPSQYPFELFLLKSWIFVMVLRSDLPIAIHRGVQKA